MPFRKRLRLMTALILLEATKNLTKKPRLLMEILR